MTRRTLDRRTFVRTTAALGAATALAGCGGSGDGGDGGSGDGGGQQFLSEEPDYDGWFDDANNYEQTVDMTGSDSVTVDVGAGEGLAFGPAAVAVSSGTTVTWEWTGEGGQHNVSGSDGDFESETIGEEGHTFEHTFEESGIHTYVCTPHEAVGMKGAVYVE
ncbi:halocyanin domain-containing protein [Halorubrum sp. CBA1229]|jgi:halocyanin-like protein|uniref:halocyanin domain-containing protein n=1 Tax=Halorubrum sp. CBA1229 TaxID=1853699 RepID=UPI000F3C69FB|nr:halocyanin domain-containing protein [Halorubrum sp. CBA1229]QKY15417.1 halocyanin domain-containing protein [Halorubrum sp. CBA1229]